MKRVKSNNVAVLKMTDSNECRCFITTALYAFLYTSVMSPLRRAPAATTDASQSWHLDALTWSHMTALRLSSWVGSGNLGQRSQWSPPWGTKARSKPFSEDLVGLDWGSCGVCLGHCVRVCVSWESVCVYSWNLSVCVECVHTFLPYDL